MCLMKLENMSEFNFESSVCTSREQSERLLALGLKKETADMCHRTNGMGIYFITALNPLDNPNDIPAWSLHRLIELMPKCVRSHSSGDDSPRLHPYVPKFDYMGVTIENIDEILVDFYTHIDLFDNICDAIEWLIKEGHCNKQYLEE